MIHELFKPIQDRIFNQDPVLNKKIKQLKEEVKNDQDDTNTEILLRDKLERPTSS